ncbi:MAG: DUF349 domain-containing protein, partial [Candidatus Halalkalibacterium sp. M3_1C_030]
MNTIMEESNTTSQYVYEDDFSFLTKDNELFLKEGSHFTKRKLGEVKEDELESTLEELKETYSKLEEEVKQLENEESPSEDKIATLKESLESIRAVGDLDDLYERLDSLKDLSGKTDGQDEKKSAEAPKKTEKSTDTESDDSSEEAAGEVKTEKEVEKPEVSTDDTAGIEENDTEGVEEESEDPIEYYRNILDKANSLAKQNDWPYVTMELDNLSRKWGEGPDVDSEEVGKLYKKFTSVVDDFEERKKEHYEKLNKQKKDNLEKKKKLLEQLGEIVDNEEWSATGKVGS